MKLTELLYESVVDMYEAIKLTQDEFIKRVNKMFEDKKAKLPNGKVIPRYDFSKSVYRGSLNPIEFYCNKIGPNGKPHGKQVVARADSMLARGSACKLCAIDSISSSQSHNQEKFIQKAEEKWGKGRYDYSNLKYNGSEKPVDIICHKKNENGEEHGPFTIQRAQWFIGKKNAMHCPKCTKINRIERGKERLTSQDEWLKKARQIHRNKDGSPKYTYEYIENGITPYTGGRNKVIITCPKHGPWTLNKAESHIISKSGCPKCATSKGEDAMRQYLYSLGYDTIKDKKFEDCTNSWKGNERCYKYKFDAYSEELNTVFEFDGALHFIKGGFDKQDEKLESRMLDDKHKNEYCLKNKIRLVRIGYLDLKDIKNQIDKALKSDDMLWLSDKYPKAGWRTL